MAEKDIEIGKKAAKGTLTIREALEHRGGSKARTAMKKIEAMGYDLDSNWSTVSTDKFLRNLDKEAKNAQFVELGAVEQNLRKLAAQSEEGAEYGYKIGYGQAGRAYELELKTAVQPRGNRKPKGIPPAQEAIPALIKGINAIPDPQTRAAVAFNVLVPLRPGEVANIGIDDIDFETGQFKDEWRRVNKIRGAIELPEVALEILRDARDKAVANGQKTVFATTTDKMTTATKVPGGIKDQFAPFENILGREFIGSSDIRKIVPSLMVGELKLGIEVSTIMGHASTDEMLGSLKQMTASSYISPIVTSEGSAAKQALRGYHNMMASVMGLTSLNELPVTMNVDASRLTSEGAPKLGVIAPGSDVTPTPERQTIGTLTDADLGLFEEIREERSQQLQLSGTRAEKERLKLEAEMPELDEAAIRAKEERRLKAAAVRKEVRSAIDAERAQNPLDSVPEKDVEVLKKLGLWDRFAKGLKSLAGVPLVGEAAGMAALSGVYGLSKPEPAFAMPTETGEMFEETYPESFEPVPAAKQAQYAGEVAEAILSPLPMTAREMYEQREAAERVDIEAGTRMSMFPDSFRETKKAAPASDDSFLTMSP